MTIYGDGKRDRKIADHVETIFVYNASGQLVAEYSTELPTNPKISYLTEDHLGSPRIITDGIRATVSRHDYMAFGDEVTKTVGNVSGRTSGYGYGEDDEIRKQYTGYERDEESGLDYAQARYYNSSHGRFTSVDPLIASANIKNPQTFNRYSYVLNSPYKFVDPLGLLSSITTACGQCGDSEYLGTDYNDGSGSQASHDSSEQRQQDPTSAHEAAHMVTSHEMGHAVSTTNSQTSNNPVYVRKDKRITAAVEGIKKNATPLKKGEKQVLTSLKVVEGESTSIENGTVTQQGPNPLNLQALLLQLHTYLSIKVEI